MTWRTRDRLQAVFYVTMGAFWAGWGTYVALGNSRFWVAVLVIYAVWTHELRDIYCKLMGHRYTVTLMCDGAVVRCGEFAWRWFAERQGRVWTREYGHLTFGRPRGAVSVCVEHVLHTVCAE